MATPVLRPVPGAAPGATIEKTGVPAGFRRRWSPDPMIIPHCPRPVKRRRHDLCVAVAGHQVALNLSALTFMVPLGISLAIIAVAYFFFAAGGERGREFGLSHH